MRAARMDDAPRRVQPVHNKCSTTASVCRADSCLGANCVTLRKCGLYRRARRFVCDHGSGCNMGRIRKLNICLHVGLGADSSHGERGAELLLLDYEVRAIDEAAVCPGGFSATISPLLILVINGVKINVFVRLPSGPA